MNAAAPIVALAGDPGGANALAPVLEALVSSGHPLRILAYRQALQLWRERGFSPQAVDESDPEEALTTALSGAGLLLTATSVNGVDIECRATALARNLAVPSIALLDFWSNYRLRFAREDGKLMLPDAIAVMDARAVKEMAAEGFPADRLRITGQPAFDDLAARRAGFDNAHRQELRRTLGIEAENRLILYVSQPLAELYGSANNAREHLGFNEDEVLSSCEKSLATLSQRHDRKIVLAIRPHPREAREKFSSSQVGRFRAVIWDGPDRIDATLAADLVLGMNSVLLLESVLLGQFVVSVQPGLRIADPLSCNRDGRSLAVYETRLIEDALEKALFDADWRQQQLLALQSASAAKGATARMVDLVENVMKPGVDNRE